MEYVCPELEYYLLLAYQDIACRAWPVVVFSSMLTLGDSGGAQSLFRSLPSS